MYKTHFFHVFSTLAFSLCVAVVFTLMPPALAVDMNHAFEPAIVRPVATTADPSAASHASHAPDSTASPEKSPLSASPVMGAEDSIKAESSVEIATKDLPFFERILKRAETAWTEGDFDVYLPLYAWHNRLMYHTGEASHFNENPWGGGMGTSYYDEDGDQHGLFMMGFKDSNKHFQPVLGYAYIKNWSLFDDCNFGLGAAAGVSARHEMYYIPFPAALPILSIEYKNFAIQTTYIPERYNHGNVLFTWARWHMD